MTHRTFFQENITTKEKFFSFVIVFMMFGRVYSFLGTQINIGEILLILAIPFCYKRNAPLMLGTAEKTFFLYVTYAIVSTCFLCNYFDAELFDAIIRILRNHLFYSIVIFFLVPNLARRECFEKYLVYFCFFLSSFVVLQFVSFRLFGFVLPGWIPNMQLSTGISGAELYKNTIQRLAYFDYRPCGFLLEPAHAAQSLFIGSLVTLYSKNSKNIPLAIFFSLTIFLTQSSTGVFALFYLWIFYFCSGNISIIKKGFLFFIAILILVVGSQLSFEKGNSIGRAHEAMDESTADGSAYVRIYNGLNLFYELSVPLQIIGTGQGLYKYVIGNASNNGKVDSQEYMSSFSALLFESGLLGFGLFACFFVILYKKTNLLGRMGIGGYWLMSLGCSIYASVFYVWIMALILFDKREKNIIDG